MNPNFQLISVFTTIFIKLIICENNSTLVLLQIIHRHGDRTPIAFYNNDPYKRLDNWVDGLGELTPRGKQRLFNFGQHLRQRYDNYLGDSPKNIYLRSTSSDRCIESASALAASLYPPKNRWIWSKNDTIAQYWQPIGVQTVLHSTDGLLETKADCPAADAAYEETMRSKEVTEFMSSQKEFIKEIEEKTGQKFTTLRQLDYLYDTIRAEITFDEPKPVPKWITELGNNALERLKQFEWHAFQYDWSSKKVQRLRAGLIFQELIANMRNATIPHNNMKKVYSYATHDTLIVTILQALGLYSGIPPYYGTGLLFELHEMKGQYFVHLFYANLSQKVSINELDLKLCHLNESTNECHFNAFTESLKEFIPNDWHKECQLKTDYLVSQAVQWTDSNSKGSSNNWLNTDHLVLLVIGFITGILVISGIILVKWRINKKLNPNRNRVFQNSYSANNLSLNTIDVQKDVNNV